MSFDIIFMGTPVFAKEFLDHICSKDNFNVKGVFTSPPKKSNRGQKINISPVQEFCEKKNLKVFCPDKFSQKEIEIIKKINPDVILVVAYGLILPKEILKIPSCGAVNVHASLLPKWRGAAPIHRSIINGDKKTGITIMKMTEGLDRGPIYLQSEIKIGENENYGEIFNNLVDVGKKSLDMYFSAHQPYFPLEQKEDLATYAKKIEKDEIKINFQDDAYKAHKKICAFSPKPGAWFDLDSSKYKIFDSQVVKEKDLTNINKNKDLILKFKKDYLLVKKIQKEGKKIMSVEEFGRGYSNELEEIIKKFE